MKKVQVNTNYISGQEQGTGSRGRRRGGRVGETACRNGHVVSHPLPLCHPLLFFYLTSHHSITTAFANPPIPSPWLIDVSYHLCIGCLFRKQALFFIFLYPGAFSLFLSLYTSIWFSPTFPTSQSATLPVLMDMDMDFHSHLLSSRPANLCNIIPES